MREPDGDILEIEEEGLAWWVEAIREGRRPLLLFGSGHVGRAVARALAPLPFAVTWIDSRGGAFPNATPPGIRTRHSADPAAAVAAGCLQPVRVTAAASDRLLAAPLGHRLAAAV